MKVTATREQIGTLSPLRFGKAAMSKIGTVIAGGVLENVKTQKQADGSPLKRNARSTLQRKADEGMGTLSLVDHGHRLVQGRGGSYIVEATDNAVTVTPSGAVQTVTWSGRRGPRRSSASPAQLARWVQQAGYVGWFNVSTKALAAIRSILRTEVKAAGDRAARQRKVTKRG